MGGLIPPTWRSAPDAPLQIRRWMSHPLGIFIEASARRAMADRRGTTAVEFGLILPIMLATILGSFQIYSIVRAKMVTANAARVLADVISQRTSVSGTDVSDYCKAARLSMYPLPASGFAASAASVINENSTRRIDWTDRTCGTVEAITNALTTAQEVTQNDHDTTIVVQATYVLELPFGFPLPSTFTVNATALAAPRVGSAVNHH